MNEIKKNQETKPSTFRFIDDDVQKFKELAGEFKLSQSEMFEGLINNFEMNQAKQSIPDRAKEIETFQITAEKLKAMFLSSLEINQTSEERIREELALELKTKDQTIADLQTFRIDAKDKFILADEQKKHTAEKVSVLEKSIANIEKELIEKSERVQNQQKQVSTLTDHMNDMKDDIHYHKSQNVTLTEINIKLKEDKTNDQNLIQKLKNEIENQTNEIEKLKVELGLAVEQKEFFKNEIKTLKEDHQLQHQRFETDQNKLNDEIKKLREEHKQEVSDIKAEMKAEKIEAMRNNNDIKNAEYALLNQKYDQLVEENKKLIENR
jgi:chromosome segregation ATPase